MTAINRSFTFDDVRDADVLELLDNAGRGKRSALVREALRQYAQAQSGELYEQVYQACRDAVRRELAGRLVATEGVPSEVILATPDSESARNLARLDNDLAEW